MLAGLLSAWAMVSLTRILRGRPWAWSGEQGVPVLIAPDLGALFDPDHVVAPGAAKLGIAALPGVGEDPGVQAAFYSARIGGGRARARAAGSRSATGGGTGGETPRGSASVLLPLQAQAVIGGIGEVLAGAEVAFGGLNRGMAEQELDLFEFPAPAAAELGAGAAQVVGLELQSQLLAVKDDHGEHGLGRERGAGDLAVAVQRTQQRPAVMPAASHQRSTASLTQAGTGMVRRRPCLPRRSTITQRPSRCWMCSSVSATASPRRRPQPTSRASRARSRLPLRVGIGAVDERLGLRPGQPVPCPDALLFDAGDLVDAGGDVSASSQPLGAASRASFLIAARRWLMVEGE